MCLVTWFLRNVRLVRVPQEICFICRFITFYSSKNILNALISSAVKYEYALLKYINQKLELQVKSNTFKIKIITLKEETFAVSRFLAKSAKFFKRRHPRKFLPAKFSKKSRHLRIFWKKYAFVVMISNYCGIRKISKIKNSRKKGYWKTSFLKLFFSDFNIVRYPTLTQYNKNESFFSQI